jgi:ferredoxin-NADP reductase/ferredoxin
VNTVWNISVKTKERVVTVIHYEDKDIIIEDPHSVLEGLECAGFCIPYSCRKGICHSCMLQTDDPVPSQSQQGLRASQVTQGYFLACCCYPQQDMSIRAKSSNDQLKGIVVDKRELTKVDEKRQLARVVALFIEVDCSWFAGQYVDIWLDTSTVRPYSIASRCDYKSIVELHIKRHDKGRVSAWLCDKINVGDEIKLSVPRGDCFYTDSYQQNPLLMVATGTGLAPLYGILQEALHQDHTQNIYLYHAAGEPDGLYYQDELQQLEQQFSNLQICTVVRRKPRIGDIEGDVVEIVKQRHPEMRGYKIFLCGAPAMVNTLQRVCFFQGAAISDILVDAFEVSVPPGLSISTPPS